MEVNVHEGHRQRMLARLLGEGDKLEDHEILEIVLFNAIPRKNTNPIAHALIDSFGSLAGVFSAPISQLKQVEGVGLSTAQYIKCMSICYDRIQAAQRDLPVCYSPQAFTKYLADYYSNLITEQLEIFLIDENHKIFFRKTFTSGSDICVQVDCDDINQIIHTFHPKAIAVAHNHPHCSKNPSQTDDRFTAELAMLCSVGGIDLYDHFILGEDGIYSYYVSGKMQKLKEEFSLKEVIKRTIPR